MVIVSDTPPDNAVANGNITTTIVNFCFACNGAAVNDDRSLGIGQAVERLIVGNKRATNRQCAANIAKHTTREDIIACKLAICNGHGAKIANNIFAACLMAVKLTVDYLYSAFVQDSRCPGTVV